MHLYLFTIIQLLLFSVVKINLSIVLSCVYYCFILIICQKLEKKSALKEGVFSLLDILLISIIEIYERNRRTRWNHRHESVDLNVKYNLERLCTCLNKT